MPSCITFRSSPLENKEQMRIMFDAIAVTNESSFVPSSGVGDEGGDVHLERDRVYEDKSDGEKARGASVTPISGKRPAPCSPKGKKKKNFRDQCMKRLVEAYEMKAQSSKHSATSQVVDHVRNEISSLLDQVIEDGAEEGSDEHYYTTPLLKKKDNREVNHYGLKSSRKMCCKEALGMFLWACSTPQSFRQIKNKFGHSLEIISREFTDVLDSVTRDCIGAIDSTNIPVTVPATEQPKYIGRHGYPSQNVMAVCDFDMRFTFVVTGWPGSVHDTRVLLDTLLTYKEQFLTLLMYYLVDSGYPNRKGFLAPSRDKDITFLNGTWSPTTRIERSVQSCTFIPSNLEC
ncbi:hypothetical protein U9M48_028976 [Paspalum notatum var. saurae]|uniref:Transposase n=1 Tax=Paspalum notatum var. saurae TaxID=547442 RepID=A0AAQ3X1K2_PASNO